MRCCGLHRKHGLRKERIHIGRSIVEHDRVRFLSHLAVHCHVITRQCQLCRLRTTVLVQFVSNQVQSLRLCLRGQPNCLRLTLRLQQEPLLGGFGLILDFNEVTFGFVGETDFNSLGRKLGTLLVSFGTQDLLTPSTFGCSLLVHCNSNLMVGRDFRDLVPTNFQSPWHGGFLQASLDERIQPRASMQNFVQLHFSDGRSHGRLRVLNHTVQRIEGTVRRPLCIIELNEQISRNFHRNVVSCDGCLRFDIQGTFTDVNHVRNGVDQRDGDEPTGFFNGMQLSKPFHHELVTLRDDVEDGVRLCDWPVQRVSRPAAASTHAVQ
mmetsp:Transcript_8198/g.23556  ORF Transcript_8198/g.23556 Transcript_8198/m.23556 type:complete len:322 (+) Transcript_8198:237-1202(+)